MCKLIIDNFSGKNPVSTKEYGSGVTPLHLAASDGHLEVCKLIMEKLTDKNPGTAHEQTPFHWAARSGQLAVCKHMIENFSDKNPATGICQKLLFASTNP